MQKIESINKHYMHSKSTDLHNVNTDNQIIN
jgi:hypothetical protein